MFIPQCQASSGPGAAPGTHSVDEGLRSLLRLYLTAELSGNTSDCPLGCHSVHPPNGRLTSDSWQGTNSAAPRRHRRAVVQSPALSPRHPATRPRTRPRIGHVLRSPRGSQCGGCRRLSPPLAPRTRQGRELLWPIAEQPAGPSAVRLGRCRIASAGVSGAAMVGHLSEGAIAVRRRPGAGPDSSGRTDLERCKADRGREQLLNRRASGRRLRDHGGSLPGSQ